MATWHKVVCITKARQGEPQERITHLGGRSPQGRVWRLTQAEAIEGILNGKWGFFIQQGAERINLVVSMSRRGSKYIKAEVDDTEPHTLLELPECQL